jgi:predicted metal-dependent hydrolase
MKPDFSAHLIKGVELFNARRFWDAHEAWETIWLVAESEVKEFLQGLIQVAAAYHHMQRGTYRGGVRLFDSGLNRLGRFPDDYCGINRNAVEKAARLHRERFSVDAKPPLSDNEYPELILLSTGEIAPPVVQW